MSNDNIDILFVSNFSYSLNETENNIAKHLDSNIKYKILTYRKSAIDNSYSYEEFIDEKFDFIDNYSIHQLQNEFKDVNLYLSLVGERFFSNYYYGIEKTLGNKVLSYGEILFFMKSFILFLSSHIKKSNLLFTGYADNFISILTYYIGEHYNKKVITFHPISVIDGDSNFLVDGIYGKPYKNLIVKPDSKTYSELTDFMNNYDAKKGREETSKKDKYYKKGFFVIFSPNIVDIEYLKFAFFGYKVSNHKISKYMNIDRPNILNKTKANIFRMLNKVLISQYIKIFTFKVEKNIKYIYFPLQIQPEASTSARAPFYMNQLATIENISKSLPLGYKLIVKEHPLAIGMNSLNFYNKIKNIPNVVFVNSSVSGKEIIKISDLIISFGGTTLFEAVLSGKKIMILLEDYYYSESKLIFKVYNKNNIYNDIVKALDFTLSEDEIEIEKEKMLNFFYQRGFPRFENFEKNVAINLMKVYEIESSI